MKSPRWSATYSRAERGPKYFGERPLRYSQIYDILKFKKVYFLKTSVIVTWLFEFSIVRHASHHMTTNNIILNYRAPQLSS